MSMYLLKQKRPRHRRTTDGFSIIETLIAGLLLASTLTAISRMSVASLSGSKLSSERSRIEAAINNNIQIMQKEDSYFTYEWISKNKDIKQACQNPALALMIHLQDVVDEPGEEGIVRDFLISQPGILTVKYIFEAPEKAIAKEIRLIEMNPNFSSECYF